MKKIGAIKEHPFLLIVAFIIILTIIFMFFLHPTHRPYMSPVFVSEANVEHSLPNYSVRQIASNDWNKGVFVESINGSAVAGNALMIPSSDTIVMYGWAVDIDRKCPASDVFMEVNNKFVKGVYGLPRMDVKKNVGVKISPNVGFFIYFDRHLLQREQNLSSEVKFHLVDMEKRMVISSVSFPLMYQTNTSEKPTRAIKSEGWFKGLVLEYFEGGTIHNDGARYVESVADEDVIHIAGWAVDIDNKRPLKSMHLSINGIVYEIGYGDSRLDVKEAVGIAESDKLGFNVAMPRKMFQNADGTFCDHIEFYLEDKDGYISEPIRYDLVKNK